MTHSNMNEPTPVNYHSEGIASPQSQAQRRSHAMGFYSYWKHILLIALAYAGIAAAGHLMLEPLNHASILWPAAGFALAALLAWGGRMWPGVWLGSFAFNYLLSGTFEAPAIAALIATGISLQAILGSYLTRALFDQAPPLAREGEVVRFLLLAGPVSCLVSASVSSVASYSIGAVDAGQAVTMWLLWWTGDTLGVLLLTPVLLALPIAGSILPRSTIRIILPLLITAILLVSGNSGLNLIEQSRAREKATQLMAEAYDGGFHLLTYATIPLDSIERFFSASDKVTREDYTTFTSSVAGQPWLLSIDWAPRISRDKRAAFEASLRRQGLITSEVFDLDAMGAPIPSAERNEYFPVTLTEPMASNGVIIGLDHGFEAPRREAMERARDTGQITVTKMLPLLRTPQRAVLAFNPVYRVGAKLTSQEQRREALLGYVVGVFGIKQLFSDLNSIASTHQLLYRITDITSDDTRHILWDTLPEGATPQWHRTVQFADRLWQLEMQPAIPLWQPGASLPSRYYLSFSVLTGFLIAFAALSTAGRNASTTLKVVERTIELAHELDARRQAETEVHRLNIALEEKVKEQARTLEILHTKEEQLSAIVDNLPYGLVTIDSLGIVYSANPAMEQMLGYRPEEIIGKNISLLMPNHERKRHDHYIDKYLDTGESNVMDKGREVQGQHKDGRLIPLELAVTEYRVHGERFFIGSLWDISERKNFIDELTRARLGAEQASRAKSSFLAVMSHEIRTPMNGVIGLVDVLAHSRLSDYQAELVTTIRESATSLLDIIDDILDFSKIDAGRMTIEHNPVCLANLAEVLCSSMQPDAANKGVTISLFISPQIPQLVLTDSVRLRQALGNLIGNAIKFTANQSRRKGYVSVRITLGEDQPKNLVFEIVDNGIGMTQATLEQLFTPFTQAEASTTRRFGGTGLGLAITHRLVELMKGKVSVSSRPGVGSQFIVTLPFEAAEQQPAPAKPELAGIHCIVIEDPEFNSADLHAYLEHAGANVEVAEDIDSAVQLASRQAAPIVAIQDAKQQRPAVDPALSAIKGLCHLQLTRGRRQRARIEALDVISLDYPIIKRQSLVHAVALATGQANPKHSHEHPLPEIAVDTSPPSIDEARAQDRLILVAEDDPLNQQVILKQLALLGYAAEVAGNGTDALRLWRNGGYALLLTDLQMPDMDGYTLSKTIRQEEGEGRHFPILALTANALHEEANQTLAVGMDAYLTKPLQLDQLREILEKWLPKRNLAPPPPESSPPHRNGPAVDVTVLQDMIGDDHETVTGLLADYLESLHHLTQELRTAYTQNDIRQVSTITHKLKSSSRVVGALSLGDLCAEIESAAKEENNTAIDKIMPQFEATVTAVEAEISKLLESI